MWNAAAGSGSSLRFGIFTPKIDISINDSMPDAGSCQALRGLAAVFGGDSAPKPHADASKCQEHKRRICRIRRPLGGGSMDKSPEMLLALPGGVLVFC